MRLRLHQQWRPLALPRAPRALPALWALQTLWALRMVRAMWLLGLARLSHHLHQQSRSEKEQDLALQLQHQQLLPWSLQLALALFQQLIRAPPPLPPV